MVRALTCVWTWTRSGLEEGSAKVTLSMLDSTLLCSSTKQTTNTPAMVYCQTNDVLSERTAATNNGDGTGQKCARGARQTGPGE